MVIVDANILNDSPLEIYIKYDNKLLSLDLLKKEILTFLDIANIPSILAFDKHLNVDTSLYKMIREDICCDYCFKNVIGSLFDLDGVVKVQSNFDEVNYFKTPHDDREDVVISIKYDSALLSDDDMKQIDKDLDFWLL